MPENLNDSVVSYFIPYADPFLDKPFCDRAELWGRIWEQTRKTANGTSNPPGWVVEALQGVAEGARATTGSKLAEYFTDKKIPSDIVQGILDLWNEKNKSPLEEDQIRKIVESISRYHVNGDPQNENA
jgi:hypothetical protein